MRSRNAIRVSVAILAFVSCGSAPFASVVNVRGAGSCDSWIKDQESERRNQKINTGQDWLIGYLSGLAIGSGVDFWGEKEGNGTDNESIFLWMDNYCRANPLKDIGHGADELFLERTRNLK